jgi:hypothetical protein
MQIICNFIFLIIKNNETKFENEQFSLEKYD